MTDGMYSVDILYSKTGGMIHPSNTYKFYRSKTKQLTFTKMCKIHHTSSWHANIHNYYTLLDYVSAHG